MLVPLCCVPSMALILLVQVQSRVFTAKCSEPQVGISNEMYLLLRRKRKEKNVYE